MTREWRIGIKFTPSLQIQMSFLVFSLVSMRRVTVFDSNELSRVTPYCQLCICVAIGNDVEDYIYAKDYIYANANDVVVNRIFPTYFSRWF